VHQAAVAPIQLVEDAAITALGGEDDGDVVVEGPVRRGRDQESPFGMIQRRIRLREC
jgi:hypothetical protein